MNSSKDIPAEMSVFTRMLAQNGGWIEAMTANLARHNRPARRAAPTSKEFWTLVTITLMENIISSKEASKVDSEVPAQLALLRNSMVSADRLQVLRAAFSFDEAQFRSIFAHLKEEWAK